MAKTYIVESGGNKVLQSSSGKSTSSPYTSNAGSNPKAKIVDTTTSKTTTRSTGSSGGTVAQEVSYSGGGGGGSGSSEGNNYINLIKDLLAEQQKKAEAAAKARWEQADTLALQDYEGNRDAYNVYKEKGERWIRNKYSPYSGLGISASIANNANWLKNLATNKQNYTNNKATNLATYNTELSNAANTMAQGYYNYVLPYYTNEAVNDRNLEFRKYLAGLNL